MRKPNVCGQSRRGADTTVLKTKQKSKKNKAIPVTGRGGLQGCEMLGIPYCLRHSAHTWR
jgi:hypothetical protein